MADLRTDYQDDVLDASENTSRVYDLVDSDGNVVLAGVHLEDKTVYTTEGDDYGAADINNQNTKINQINADLSAIRSHIGMIVQSTTLDTEAKVKAIYGGTSWSKIEGRVLVGEGTLDSTHTYTINATGGEPEHKLTINEMPKHSHPLAWFGQAQAGGSGTSVLAGGATPVINSSSTGGDQVHNIMQPYKVVYIWERTA